MTINKHNDEQRDHADNADQPPPFTMKELDQEIKHLKPGKARDQKGLVAEMPKVENHTMRLVLLDLYNDIIKPTAQPPHNWKQTVSTVIFKSGDAHLPQNYRPICTIPLLY